MPHHRIFAMACAPALLGAALIPVFAATLLVGPARTYKVPSAVAGVVNDGDTVLIDAGTYVADVAAWTKNNLTLRGTARYAHLQGCGSRCSGDKAIWVIGGQNTTIENIEFSDAAISDNLGANGAGIRQEGATVTIRNCYFHDCQDGILAGANASSVITIEYSEFARCGLDPCPTGGCVHNMYIGAVGEFTLRGCYTHSAVVGHTVKSRALKNYILYNRIMSEQGSASLEIDLPNGGTSYIIGNEIEQGPNSENSGIIGYGEEGISNHDSSLYIVNNTIVNDKGGGTFITIANTRKPARIVNNLFVGAGTLYSGVVDTAANIRTNTPAFVDKNGYDYRPTSATPGINGGVDPGSANGFGLAPVLQYVDSASTRARAVLGSAIDVGAYEYSPASVMFPRPRPQSAIYAGDARFSIDGRRIPGEAAPKCRSANSPAVWIDVRGNRSIGGW